MVVATRVYDRILVATDGSDAARRAATHAVDLARRYGATLHAVYVVETRTEYDNAIVDPSVVRRNLREEGEAAVDEVASLAGGDVDVRTAVREGVPHEELLAYAEERDVDLIVVGAKGRAAVSTLLLGSVADAVVRTAPVPVLVVGSPEDGETTGDGGTTSDREPTDDRETTGDGDAMDGGKTTEDEETTGDGDATGDG